MSGTRAAKKAASRRCRGGSLGPRSHVESGERRHLPQAGGEVLVVFEVTSFSQTCVWERPRWKLLRRPRGDSNDGAGSAWVPAPRWHTPDTLVVPEGCGIAVSVTECSC
jgi:hypothetical protein